MGQPPLDRLCALFGIANEYYDTGGTLHPVPDETKRRLLQAMGVPDADNEDIEATVAAAEAERWRRRLEPVAIGREGDTEVSLFLTRPEIDVGSALAWQLQEESGREHYGILTAGQTEILERRQIDGEHWVSTSARLAVTVVAGYHRVEVFADEARQITLARCLLMVAPRRCYKPAALEDGYRAWGITAQLYALRSQRNWGIGDFTDLLRLVEFAASQDAGFVGVNPLHSPLDQGNAHASPYNPSNRLFLNSLYLDVEAIPDFAEAESAREHVASDAFQAQLRSLRAAELADYDAIGAAKSQVLELLFAHFRRHHVNADTDRARQFRTFQRERGEPLHRFAAFQALHEYWCRRQDNSWGWPAWPAQYHDSRAAPVDQLVATLAERVEFFTYLQWNAHLQLTAASTRASELGMLIGLYADLALSSSNGAADTWIDRGFYLEGVHLGAPPDEFNQAGQDWGLPPWHPTALRNGGYRPFVETIRANMQLGGALRIDHVMALMRCFLIPRGSRPAAGAYVHYRFDEMLAILALESHRNRCMIIGEDLGTVPEELRQGLRDAGVLGYRVLYFEKQADGAYKTPADFDTDVLAVVSTHDLPTLAGFWGGADIEWRSEHDLFPNAAAREQQFVERAADRARLLVALEKEGLVPNGVEQGELLPGAGLPDNLRIAVHRYLGKSSSMLVGVQAEDLLGERDQMNLPGTIGEYPNWRRRLSLQLENWAAEPEVLAVIGAVRQERPAPEGVSPVQQNRPPRQAIIPRATYRVQLNREFRFADLTRLVPYLASLGVSHVYCSPYLKARPGSRHGYDIVDHTSLNPEIGNNEEFEQLCQALAANGMGHILDMVPNHMSVTGTDQGWWLDVLENGQASQYADFFDIDWNPLKNELRGKVLLPVLGSHYGNVLDTGELRLAFDDEHGSFSVWYFEHRFPVDPREYPQILEPDLQALRLRMPAEDSQRLVLESLITAFGNLPGHLAGEESARRVRLRDQKLHQRRLAELVGASPDVRRYLEECVRRFNGDEHYPADAGRLHRLLEAQPYRLAYWRVASHEINYRRFFDINELASLRMENAEVFEMTHSLILELIAGGKVHGLRIDHPDGLYDPRAYFRRLQACVAGLPAEHGDSGGAPLYLLAEKILAVGEELREDWPVHGTTGYEFINLINRFLVRGSGIEQLADAYAAFIGRRVSYEEVLHRCKTLIMQTSLASELNVLTAELDRIAEQDPHTRDFGLGGLRNALSETVACFPVYRTYCVGGEVSAEDKAVIDHALDVAKKATESADTSVFEFLRDVLLNRISAGKGEAFRRRVADFGMHLQQYTSPVAAKGMEDTAFYRYARLLSLNEVGGTPEQPAATIDALHSANLTRAERWPHSMLASSTHDTKRSEDVRARLHVLSEMPDEWRGQVEHWARINEPLKAATGAETIEPEVEYFLYQTLLGTWPLSATAGLRGQECELFVQRIASYMIKAAREAKRRTSWLNPEPAYEEALRDFIERLLDPAGSSAFMAGFLPFQHRVARLGLYNSLSQLALKLTCPGVPDIYQGAEIWRFDLVDPDNRRSVDFDQRTAMLVDIRRRFEEEGGRRLAGALAEHPEDPRLKLFLTWRGLALRQQYPRLFESGEYRPLQTDGDGAEHVLAFSRKSDGLTLVVAVLRWFSALVDGRGKLDTSRLSQVSIELPLDEQEIVDGLTGDALKPGAGRLPASQLFAALPVVMWIGRDAGQAHAH